MTFSTGAEKYLTKSNIFHDKHTGGQTHTHIYPLSKLRIYVLSQ